MGTKTKLFTSDQLGAPTMNSAAGQLLGVLDACLCDGFGLKSITAGSITGGVCTISLGTSHAFTVDTVVEIAGATPSGLNGQWRVTSSTSTSFSFSTAVTGAVSAAGTVKVAPLGWEKLYTGTNVRAYRSLDPTSNGMILRVDDTGTINALVRGYESMTDIDTGIGAFPTVAQVAGAGGVWGKANDTTNRNWFIVGDSRGFYYGHAMNNTIKQMTTWFFGDFLSYRSGDVFATYLAHNMAASYNGSGTQVTDTAYSNRDLAARGHAPRNATALGSSIATTIVGAMNRANSACSGNGGGGYDLSSTFPNPTDNGLILFPVQVSDTTSRLRGELPGLLHTGQVIYSNFSPYDRVTGTGQYAGSRLLYLLIGAPNGSADPNYRGSMFINLSDWR